MPFRTGVLVKPLLAIAATTAAALYGACGAITAPVSLPEAFAHNGDLGLRGSITDDLGEPLDQVLVTIDRTYYLWHASGSYDEYSKITVAADRNFSIPKMRARALTFTFRKAGYMDQQVAEAQDGTLSGQDGQSLRGSKWPAQDVRIVMAKADRAPPTLAALDVQVDYTDPDKNPAIDLSQARTGGGRSPSLAVRLLEGPAPPPPGLLLAKVVRQPLKTTGAERRVDPLDINLPASLTLQFSDPEGGFVPFAPSPGSGVFRQMGQAPENGYLPTLVLDSARLRKMRDNSVELIPERNVFFYFRAGGKYGKAIVTWAGNGETLELSYSIVTQPDGTRNLAGGGR